MPNLIYQKIWYDTVYYEKIKLKRKRKKIIGILQVYAKLQTKTNSNTITK